MERIIDEIFGPDHCELDSEVQELYRLLRNTFWYPIDLPRFFGKDDDIGMQLTKVLNLFYRQINIYGIEKFQKLISQVKNEVHAFTPYPDKLPYAQVGIINHEYSKYFFNVDKQVQLPSPEMGIYKEFGIRPDTEGLVAIDSQFDAQKGGLLFNRDTVLYYSPFFRRYFTGRFTELTEIISELSKKTRVLVSLDHERNFKSDVLTRIDEFDHWWGPIFDIDKFSDPYFEGTTIYGRTKVDTDDITKLPAPYPIIRTEFKIKNIESGIKQIEIEEITPFQRKHKLSETHHFQRYMHAYWEPEKQMFSHFDLAIQVYELASYKQRVQTPWNDKSGSKELSKRSKILRIDNYLSYQEALDIVAYFYRGNELIHQFFSGTNTPEGYLMHSSCDVS